LRGSAGEGEGKLVAVGVGFADRPFVPPAHFLAFVVTCEGGREGGKEKRKGRETRGGGREGGKEGERKEGREGGREGVPLRSIHGLMPRGT